MNIVIIIVLIIIFIQALSTACVSPERPIPDNVNGPLFPWLCISKLDQQSEPW